MIFHYLDASAWVKRYYQEPGAAWVQHLFSGNPFLACAPLGLIEVMATLARKGKGPGLPQATLNQQAFALQQDWQLFIKINLTSSVIQPAVDVTKTFALRGADAIHLASALELQQRFVDQTDQLIVVTSDHELFQAAQLSGLTVIDPVQSPSPTS